MLLLLGLGSQRVGCQCQVNRKQKTATRRHTGQPLGSRSTLSMAVSLLVLSFSLPQSSGRSYLAGDSDSDRNVCLQQSHY